MDSPPDIAGLHARAKAVFLEACDLPPEERGRLLDEACAGDELLRAEVESLLGFAPPAPSHSIRPTVVTGVPPDPLALAPGTPLGGRYLAHEELGRGGMGRVYRATDLTFSREVALKLLALSGPAARRSFEREARLLNALRHRALPVVTDFFADEERCCLVMDFIRGEDLAALAARRRASAEGLLELDVVLGWADQVLDALCYLGSFDPPVVHRDIKPQNLKLTARGEVMLLDFGLAKGPSGAQSGALRSVPGYTPRFAPLEQMRGGGTDPRSDLYSLGVTIYYLLTGTLAPDAAERAGAIVSGRADPLARLDAVRPDIPAAVADVLRAATAVAKEDRPASAAEMRRALLEASGGVRTAPPVVNTRPDGAAALQDTGVLEERPGNLPEPVTGFVGRERELAEVLGLSAASRLVTVTGPGGIGKTRLALRAAAELLDELREGAWFVDLSAVADPANVAHAIVLALGVDDESGRPPLDVIAGALRSSSLLLVLDNCEHLVAECARVAARLLRDCPRVRLLATSRERLGVPGEAVFPLGPLDVSAGDPSDAAASDAVRLFVSRARLARPAFALGGQNAAAVTEICRRLEGIPLAIELAAARVAVLSPEQILARLGDRFALLTTRDRTGPSRQQTLRSAIDWSYDLLDPGEQALLRRLSVFPGGWTLEAAEMVGTGRQEVPGARDQVPGARDQVQGARDQVPGKTGAGGWGLGAGRQGAGQQGAGQQGAGPQGAGGWGPGDGQSGAGSFPAAESSTSQSPSDADDSDQPPAPSPQPPAYQSPAPSPQPPSSLAPDTSHLAPPSDVLDLLSALVDKSLVRAEERDGDVRYRMLETVREYATERLLEAGEARAALGALFEWALELGEQSRTALREGGEREWLPRLDAELDNLRAATTWALSSDDAPAGATRLPRSLMTYMRLRALLVEARSWIDAALARCPDSDPLERVRLLVDAGILATMRDEHRRALGLYGEAIDVARARDFQPQLENALLNAGISCAQLGEYEAAIRYFHEALDVARRLGNRMGEAYVLTNLGMTLLNRDGPESAAEVMEAAHACAREVRATVLLPIITLYRGLVALARGDTAAAEPLLRDAVAQWRHSGERSSFGEVLDWLASVEDLRGRPELADELLAESAAVRADLGTRQGLIDTLDGHARVAFQRARWERALTLAGAAEAAREAGGNPLAPFDRRLFEAAHARAVAAIGEAAAGAAFEAGRAMALEDAVALARGLTGAPDGV